MKSEARKNEATETDPPTEAADEDADTVYEQELANLVTQLSDRVTAGENLLLELVVKEHPKFADDLRELWGVIIVTKDAGEEQRREATHEMEREMAGLDLPYDLGNYVLRKEIGRGGMGIVYKAKRKSDDMTVAIKMILKGEFSSRIERERFRAEAEAAKRLEHPNIIPIYDIGEHDGLPFFCMKLIEGQSLSEKLIRGPIFARQAGQIMDRISDAIGYAHQQGVLHRDLKPSNVMLDETGKPYIADFGLAKQATASEATLTRTGAVIGTPSYMSPEQASGIRGDVGVASDIYSLGAILYNMITGRPPFLGATSVETVLMVMEQDPIAPHTINRRVDRDLEMITMRCLQKPRDLRYESAMKLRDDVRAWLEGRSVSAREGRFGQVIANLFRETHHAEVLENWGVLWMWHSLVLIIASVATHVFSHVLMISDRWPYLLMWTLGVGVWAVVFWVFRRRMGPVTFVERQIAHVWAAAMGILFFLFPLEARLGLEVLTLAPMLALIAAMVFLVKAGILSGSFYVHAVALFVTAIVMLGFPEIDMLIFGFVSAACFFLAGLKYYRRKKRHDMRKASY